MIRQQKNSVWSTGNQPDSMHNENSSLTSSNSDIQTFLGKSIYVNHNQFFVESILGQGGFAFVFLVRSIHYPQQRYALKRMYVNNRRDLLVCNREINLLKEFSSHKNIIHFVDASTRCLRKRSSVQPMGNEDDDDDDSIYEILLLTEFCNQGTLFDRLIQQRRIGSLISETEILKMFADLCRAISICHFRRPNPILHRDIKIENIIVHSDQSFVLCDFGSAVELSKSKVTGQFEQYPDQEMTTTLIRKLEEEIQRYTTLAYRSPEMVNLYARIPITLKADIWAMGCLLYKLMYGVLPFGESSLAIQNGIFVIPDDQSHLYSRELKQLLRYILEVDINKRPDIWQISFLTFKLLGQPCPISNHCHLTQPDLSSMPVPLTNSAFNEQRKLASAKQKSNSTQILNEMPPVGTAINPRERPRGMIPPSNSLMNFKLTKEPVTSSTTNPSSHNTTNQSTFNDHANKPAIHVSKLLAPVDNAPIMVVPSAPISSSSSSQSHQTHRRSVSQTVTSTTTPETIPNTSSVDFPQALSKDEENWWINTPDSQIVLQEQHLRTNGHHRSLSNSEKKSTVDSVFLEFDPYQSERTQESKNPSNTTTNTNQPTLTVHQHPERKFTNLNMNNTTTYTTNVQFYPFTRPEMGGSSSSSSVKPSTVMVHTHEQLVDRTPITTKPPQTAVKPHSSNEILHEFF